MTMREEVYMRAWKELEKRIEIKTSWGKNELKTEMAKCMSQAVDDSLLE